MNWYGRLKLFLEEVWAELKKTSWPSRKEVYGTTLVVIIMVVLCSVYLWVIDLALQKPAEAIYPH